MLNKGKGGRRQGAWCRMEGRGGVCGVGDLTTLQCHGIGASVGTTWKQKKRKAEADYMPQKLRCMWSRTCCTWSAKPNNHRLLNVYGHNKSRLTR